MEADAGRDNPPAPHVGAGPTTVPRQGLSLPALHGPHLRIAQNLRSQDLRTNGNLSSSYSRAFTQWELEGGGYNPPDHHGAGLLVRLPYGGCVSPAFFRGAHPDRYRRLGVEDRTVSKWPLSNPESFTLPHSEWNWLALGWKERVVGRKRLNRVRSGIEGCRFEGLS